MTTPLVWLDLCSGLGGASQPALDRGWRVIRVDVEARFKPDIVADVRALPLAPFHVDVLWASPPCQEFSKWGLRCFYPNPKKPDLSIAQAVKTMVERWKPHAWFVENVRSARKFLNPIFGPPRCVTSGHVLWSNVLVLFPDIRPHKNVLKSPHTRTNYSPIGIGHCGPDPSVTAKIPYEIGEAICRAVEGRRGA